MSVIIIGFDAVDSNLGGIYVANNISERKLHKGMNVLQDIRTKE